MHHDLRLVLRQLLKRPGFVLVSVVTLALGIGANTAMFSFINSLLLRPLPFPAAEELSQIRRVTPQGGDGRLAMADFLEFRRESGAALRVAAYERTNQTLDDSEQPTPWVQVTPDLFEVLGVRAEVGRGFREEESQSGNHQVVLISRWLWRERFGGSSDVIGRTLRSGGQVFEIVGVLPPAATDHRLFNQVDVFSPLILDGAGAVDRQTRRLNIIARRQPGILPSQAEAYVVAWGARVVAENPAEEEGTRWLAESMPKAGMSPTGRFVLAMFLGLSGFVLLIACSNLANLLLARTVERARELSVRLALGAGRRQLLRPAILEAGILTALGGFGALVVTRGTTQWLHQLIRSGGGPTVEFPFDVRVLGFATVVSLATVVFFGVGPAWVTLRIRANAVLQSGTRGATQGRHQSRLVRGLIGAQFAAALILLSGAGFFVRGAMNRLGEDLGWQSGHVVQCRLAVPSDAYPTEERLAVLQRELLTRLRGVPGVRSASLSTEVPFLGFRTWTHYVAEGGETRGGPESRVFLNEITPEYFEVLSSRLVRGRGFTDADSPQAPRVALLSESLARRLFPGRDAVGGRVMPAGSTVPDWFEVVGVVEDARSADVADPVETWQIHRPLAQHSRRAVVLAVQHSEGAATASIVTAVRAALRELDPRLEVRELMGADRLISRLTSQFDMARRLLLAFAVLGVFLALLGIYGMMARTIAQRTGEIGIRMALGAQIRDVVGLVVGSGVRVAAVGIATGVLGAFGFAKLLAVMLPAMQGDMGLVILVSLMVLLLLAAVASWIPSRRVSQILPTEALRGD
ncbi:MAG: ABC transporter permease [Verrucomicrobiales bacterium]|nr:ABC transporter permease [Verrucomicrobiales bacterium]